MKRGSESKILSHGDPALSVPSKTLQNTREYAFWGLFSRKSLPGVEGLKSHMLGPVNNDKEPFPHLTTWPESTHLSGLPVPDLSLLQAAFSLFSSHGRYLLPGTLPHFHAQQGLPLRGSLWDCPCIFPLTIILHC